MAQFLVFKAYSFYSVVNIILPDFLVNFQWFDSLATFEWFSSLVTFQYNVGIHINFCKSSDFFIFQCEHKKRFTQLVMF